MKVVIIAGGKGERFWPLSRKNYPKQFLPITSSNSMLYETIERLKGLVDLDDIYISTRIDLALYIHKIVPEIPLQNYICEPQPKDTAAAIGLATIYINKNFPGSTIIILPSDHFIKEKEIFQEDLEIAVKIAKTTSCLLTFGITPTRPDTGYGYIELGEIINKNYSNPAYEVKSFKEKPDLNTAKFYLEKGNFVWNSGMFVWTTNAILESFEKYMPELYKGLMEIEEAIDTKDQNETIIKVFEKLPKISIDYGIMEKADNVLCLKARFTWDDVGAWTSLERILKPNENNNIIKALWYGKETKNSIIVGNPEKLIVTLGINNLVIVQTDDAILIMDKSKEQEVKKIVEEISKNENLSKFV
jgi:mannose-1-phosphate guanylyltransferase